jgi:hypothetical protein
MYNRREYKVVALNGKPLYIASIATGYNKVSKPGINEAFGSTNRLLEFAGEAIEQLLSNAPFAITDGLMRVDIFEDATGCMVVNKF